MLAMLWMLLIAGCVMPLEPSLGHLQILNFASIDLGLH
jgi:hypothetical protein